MRYIRFKELQRLVPLGRTTIWRMQREGTFPQSRRIGKIAKAWVEDEVLAWMKARASDHTSGNAQLPARKTWRRRRPATRPARKPFCAGRCSEDTRAQSTVD
ncbi:MAG: AlpA family phage regulatory protein [Acidobacteriota bacterium]